MALTPALREQTREMVDKLDQTDRGPGDDHTLQGQNVEAQVRVECVFQECQQGRPPSAVVRCGR